MLESLASGCRIDLDNTGLRIFHADKACPNIRDMLIGPINLEA